MDSRLDKFLWASRLYKTRTLAAEACKNGRVTIADKRVKPSRPVKEGDVIQIHKPPVTYTFRILQAIQHRIGAKLVPQVIEDITTPDQYELLEMQRIGTFVARARGTGRPTKKERRDLDNYFAPDFFDTFDPFNDDATDEAGAPYDAFSDED